MFRLPTILTADELLDTAFRRASKVNVTARSKIDMIRKKNIAKISSASDSITSTLRKYIKAFPTLEELPAFYRELVDLLIGIDKMKKSLGALDWCSSQIEKISRKYSSQIRRSRSVEDIDSKRAEMYGRTSSLLKQISKDLKLLGTARDQMRKLPSIDPSKKTIVVAGAPNVGKSQLVKAMSTAKPKVASYPFTTREISIGLFSVNRRAYQIIDTPGLLDRPLEERNEIERRAIIALKHLSDLVIFVIDSTGTCGYPTDFQLSLFSGIKEQLPSMRIIAVDSKSDLLDSSGERIAVSAINGDGLSELKELIDAELSAEDQ